MATIGEAVIEIGADARGFSRDVDQQVSRGLDGAVRESGRAGERAGSQWSSALGGALLATGKIALGAVAGVAAVIGGIAAKGGIERALAIEDAQAKLAGLGHSAQTIETIMNSALESVQGTAFGLGDAATLSATAVAAGIKPGEELTRTLKLTADAATIAGTSLADMGSIFGQVAAAGVLMGDDIAQLQDRGIPILQLVGDQLGVTAAEAKKLASEGQVSFATFQNAIEAGMGGAALKSGETFRGSLANVQAALGRLGEAAAAPILQLLTRAFQAAIPIIDSLTQSFQPVIDAMFGAGEGSEALSDQLSNLSAFVEPVRQAFQELMDTAARELGPVFEEIGKTVKNDLLPALNEILPILGPIVAFIVRDLGKRSIASIVALIEIFSGLIKVFSGVVNTVAALIRGDWRGAFNSMSRVVEGTAQIITGVLRALLGTTTSIGTGIQNSILNPIERMRSRAISSIQSLRSGVTGVLSRIASSVSSIGQRVADGFLRPLAALIGRALGVVSGLRSRLTSALSIDLSSAGRRILTSLASGMIAGLSAVVAQAQRAASAIRDFFPFSPAKTGPLSGSGSPDKSGEKIMEMLSEGMNQAQALPQMSLTRALTPISPQGVRNTVQRSNTLPVAGGPSTNGNVTVNQNYFGPTTSGSRTREIDWTLRYSTRYGDGSATQGTETRSVSTVGR